MSVLLAATAARAQDIDMSPVSSLPSASLAPYAFSDELGGFSIAAVSGIGTRDDPVRIAQSFLTTTPVTLVVRATRPINPFGQAADYATGTIHMVLEVSNDSGIPWIGFELELQERFEEPSVYGDGLSFDQRHLDRDGVRSSAFATARTDFEPYDRILFENGALDPDHNAEFRFLITDLTPIRTFYVRLDPRIPAS